MKHFRRVNQDMHDIIHIALKIHEASKQLNDKIDEMYKREQESVRDDDTKRDN